MNCEINFIYVILIILIILFAILIILKIKNLSFMDFRGGVPQPPVGGNEINNLPEIVVRETDKKASFYNLWRILGDMKFFKDNGYLINLPDNDIVNKILNNSEELKDIDKEEFRKIFIDQIYRQIPTEPIKDIISDGRELLNNIFKKLRILNKNWGFEVYDKYYIHLTLWGVSGSYNRDTQSIVIMTDGDGIPKTNRKSVLTIIHEMVHIGIENIIVKKYNLTHKEKEHVVNMICREYLGNLLPDYKYQTQGTSVLTYNAIMNDLPNVIDKYKKSQKIGADGSPNIPTEHLFDIGFQGENETNNLPKIPSGLFEEGNIDLQNRPMVKGETPGVFHTVYSMSITEQLPDGRNIEVLFPRVIKNDDGEWFVASKEQSIKYYKKTGQHLGKFLSREAVDNYARDLHVQQEKMYTSSFDINFEIDKIILLGRGLMLTKYCPFSKEFKEIIERDFQNEIKYIKDNFPNLLERDLMFVELIKFISKNDEFKYILDATEKYKDKISSEWSEKKYAILNHLSNILKISVDKLGKPKIITCVIMHPNMRIGRYAGKINKIIWGHYDDWENYSMVYLMHEFLHSMLGCDSFIHPIIELATDQELRVRLNTGDEYFIKYGNRVGHAYTQEESKKLLNKWKSYLLTDETIFEFIDKVKGE